MSGRAWCTQSGNRIRRWSRNEKRADVFRVVAFWLSERWIFWKSSPFSEALSASKGTFGRVNAKNWCFCDEKMNDDFWKISRIDTPVKRRKRRRNHWCGSKWILTPNKSLNYTEYNIRGNLVTFALFSHCTRIFLCRANTCTIVCISFVSIIKDMYMYFTVYRLSENVKNPVRLFDTPHVNPTPLAPWNGL